MKIIVGLGNPGEKYANNRHNVGFMFVNYLLNENVTRFKFDKYLKSEIVQLKINNKDVVLAKPQTFMNNSGIAVKSCITRYQAQITQDLYVVHDDLDIPLGKFKIQKGAGPKLHKGIRSIEEFIGTKNFWRIRIGVDNRPQGIHIPGETYVLQDFTPSEKQIVEQLFVSISLRLQTLLDNAD